MNNLSEESVLRRSELLLSAEYQKPEDETGEIIAGIWQRVLNVDLVGLHDDFFEIGGDSLGASVLAGELESRFHCKFSPSHIVEASTVATQIAYIERQKEKQKNFSCTIPSNLIVFNEGGRKTPLFIVHGAVGFTIYDKRFLEGIDKDQPIVFIEAPGLDGKESPLERIETMAEYYLRAMRQIAPEGNWLLAANCSGGLIAMEMCRQAEGSGEKVSQLMLIDPLPHLFLTPRQKQWRRLKKKWRIPRLKSLRTEWKQMTQFLKNYLSRGDDKEAAAYESSLDDRSWRQSKLETRFRMRADGQQTSWVPSETIYSAEAMRQVSRSFGKAVREYALPGWEGRVFVLRSSDSNRDADILNTYFPNAKSRSTPYSHHNLFTDGLPDILKFLNDAINAASGEPFLL